MTSVILLEREHPDTDNPDYIRVTNIFSKLTEAGFPISRIPASTSSNAAVSRLLEQHGEKILPITLVNNFPMITGRYPANDELKQILSVPDGILEPKHCGCCCIEGCGCE